MVRMIKAVRCRVVVRVIVGVLSALLMVGYCVQAGADNSGSGGGSGSGKGKDNGDSKADASLTTANVLQLNILKQLQENTAQIAGSEVDQRSRFNRNIIVTGDYTQIIYKQLVEVNKSLVKLVAAINQLNKTQESTQASINTVNASIQSLKPSG